MYLNSKRIVTIEKLFINAIVYSFDKNNTTYEAMGIGNGKILFLGTKNDAMNLLDNNTEIIDLKYKIVIPSFVDAYVKIPQKLIMNKEDLSLFECKNLKEYEMVIKEYINKHIDKEVIYGCGWELDNFISCDKFHKGPNKKILNDICENKAIILSDVTGKMLWLNDKAFERFKITKNTYEPIGGKIELDENGELWGILKDNAVNIININEFKTYKNKDYLNSLMEFQKILHSYGITSIGLVENNFSKIPYDVYRMAEIKDKLKLRIDYGVNIFPYEIGRKTIYEQLHDLKRLKIIYKSKYFDISRACFEADGLIEMQSAFLFKPYRNNQDDSDYTGRFKWDVLEFKEGIKMANRLDFNVIVEAIGDNACKVSMDGIEYSQKNNNYNKCRNSIVHLSLITKYYLRRMKTLELNAIIHPFWYYQNSVRTKYEYEFIGEDRIQRLYPYKSLINNNILIASSCEYFNEESINPIKGVWCSVTRNLYKFSDEDKLDKNIMMDPKYRLNPDERVTVMEALKSFTIDAAYILGRESYVGSIEIGKNADFIVLDKNIFTSNFEEISDINVCRTYFEGQLVYNKE